MTRGRDGPDFVAGQDATHARLPQDAAAIPIALRRGRPPYYTTPNLDAEDTGAKALYHTTTGRHFVVRHGCEGLDSREVVHVGWARRVTVMVPDRTPPETISGECVDSGKGEEQATGRACVTDGVRMGGSSIRATRG